MQPGIHHICIVMGTRISTHIPGLPLIHSPRTNLEHIRILKATISVSGLLLCACNPLGRSESSLSRKITS
eukprot:jgi/Botrbrau1/12941/Bobra.154_2s0003.1